jgi:hypothetical protein
MSCSLFLPGGGGFGGWVLFERPAAAGGLAEPAEAAACGAHLAVHSRVWVDHDVRYIEHLSKGAVREGGGWGVEARPIGTQRVHARLRLRMRARVFGQHRRGRLAPPGSGGAALCRPLSHDLHVRGTQPAQGRLPRLDAAFDSNHSGSTRTGVSAHCTKWKSSSRRPRAVQGAPQPSKTSRAPA